MVAPSSGRCGTFLVLVCLLLKSLPSDAQFVTASDFIPPSGVRSSVNNHAHDRRFNIRAGDSFTITCNVLHNSLAFIAELYLDNRSTVITDGLLPNTTYSKTGTGTPQINLELTFDNFQAVHNGEYECFTNTTDGSAESLVDLRLYGTGPITVTLLSSQYQIFYSDEDIVIPTQIRGEFFDIDWYYHATDPLLASVGRVTLIDGPVPVTGAGNVRFSQELVITRGTMVHRPGYYAPEILDTSATTRSIMPGESVLVRAYASPTASLPTVENQSPGADLTVTCTATGYPEPTISFSTSDISASSSMGEHVTTTTATPSTVYTTTRSITFSSLLASDCGTVTCTASNADRDGTQTTMPVTTQVLILGSPDVTIAPSADQAISIGGNLTLSCTAQDCTTMSFVYMWYRDGVNVENSTSLSISGASSSDFGRYECNVTGDGGTGSAVTYISEQNSLTLTSELAAPPNPSLSTVEGSSVDHYNIESQATFSISCTFESPNNFDLEASKDGVVLSTDPVSTSTLSSPTRTSKTLTIQLSSFSTSDNAVYQCNASNSERELLSRRVLLTTGALSAMRVSEEFIELVPPNSLQLEVSVDGAFSSLQWYRGSQQLMEGSGGISFSDFSRSLTISNTSSSDAGQYQLIASDSTTNVSVIFEVQVFLEPNFTISTTPEVVVIEDSVNVTCSAQSFPEHFNLRLVFNGSNLTASSSSPAEFSESSRQFSAQTVYTIDSAQPDDHEGNYTCTVEVTRGSPSSTTTYTSAFFLDVNGPTAPNVTVNATPESVAVGDSGVLVCQASGGQPASYSFSWSNSTGDTVSSGVTSSGSRSTLNITEAADADFDTYTCTVSSAYWNVSASGNFTELDLPLASLSLSNPDPVVLGASVGLDCSSVGRAPFNLSILVDGEVLASRNGAGRAEDLTYELLISNEANYTEYTCQAVNMFGSDNTTVTVVRATPPNVTAVSELEQTITVDSGFTLQAEIAGYNLPIDSVVWQRGSEALNSSGSFNISSDTGTLGSGSATLVVQSTASLVDDALYTLTVTNPAGNDTLVFNVTIQIAPMATLQESFSPTVREYSSGTVVCNVTGTPSPNITWTFGGRTAMNGSEFNISRVDTLMAGNTEVMSTLTVLNASRGDLFSEVVCQASNGIGADVNDSTQLLVEFAPNITFLSEEQTILASTSVSISCTVDTYPQSSISWYLDGQAVDSSRVTTVALGDGRTQNSTLTISSASTEDSGTYRCRANNSVSMDTMETQLTVEIAPLVLLEDLVVNETQTANLTCNVTGTPQASITWYLVSADTGMSVELMTDVNYTIIEEVSVAGDKNVQVVSVLSVLNAMKEDSGLYRCNATNTRGMDSSTANLTVQYAPRILNHSNDMVVVSTEDITRLLCGTDALPDATISWYFGDMMIPPAPIGTFNGQGYQLISTSVNFGEEVFPLSILAMMPTDPAKRGTYTCVAENLVGRANESIVLEVQAPPSVSIVESSQIKDQEQNATFTCLAVGVPAPDVTWQLDANRTGVVFNITADNMKYSITSMTTMRSDTQYEVRTVLTITDLTLNDTGLYVCTGTNAAGADSDQQLLAVRFTPVIRNITGSQIIIAVSGADINCTVESFPEPKIEWLFNGKVISDDNNLTATVDNTRTAGTNLLTSTLNLFRTDPSSAGTYTCNATNALGTATADTDLVIHVRTTITFPERNNFTFVVNEGNDVTFECSAFGIPAPSLSWRRLSDNTTLSSNDSRVTIGNPVPMTVFQSEAAGSVEQVNRTLTLSMAADGDSGSYECVASNMVGSGGQADTDRQEFQLYVRVAPVFLEVFNRTEVTYNSPLMLYCSATATPRPNITWYYEGTEVDVELSDTAVMENPVGERVLESTLMVNQPFIDMNGTYRCNASNVVSTISSEDEVEIFSQPFIRMAPGNVTVNQTDSASLVCTAQGNPLPTITWTGVSSDFTDSVSYDSNFTVTSTLSIASTTRSVHEGQYTCAAENGVEQVLTEENNSASGIITVQVPPTVIPVEPMVIGINFMNAILSFTIQDASPEVVPVAIYWTFTDVNGTVVYNPIVGGEDFVFSADNLNLTLINVTNMFEGTYTLVASNAAGSNSATVEVIVEGPPRFIVTTERTQTVNGTDLTLSCYTVAEPLHTVTWFFTNASNVTVEIGSSNMTVAEGFTINNKTVPVMLGGEAEVMAAMPAQYGSLTIFNPQFRSRGLYSCRPENLYGSIETSTAVAVQVSPFILDTSPQTEVLLDAAWVVLNCTIRGFPLSNVVWNLNGRERPAQVSDLAVTTVRAQDMMPYSFHDGSSMSVVPVQDLEYFDAVSYLTFNRPVRRTDTGNYSCTGISQLGDSMINVTSDDVRLFILEVPDAPENVSISNSTDRGQLVTWDAPFTGNSPITSYKVFLSSSRDAAFVEIFSSSLRRKRQAGGGPSVAGISDTSINVTNLIPFVTYQYMVSAINAIGTSSSSQPSGMVTTDPAAPDAPPTACVLSAVSSTAITATWTAPDPPNGVIADYTVTYRPVRAVADYDPNTFESMTNTNTGTSTPFLVAYGLQEAVEYMFEISAINQIGQGPAVTCSRLTNENTPGEPRSLSGYSPSSTSVVVSWDHPLPQDQNGLIVNYTVLSQLNTEMNMTSTNGNLTMLTLSDLDIFTDYSISVMAHTSVGAGNVTQIVVVRTLNDTSSPPQCVTINSASNDTLTVSWYPPASPRGVVSDYIMRYVGSKAYDSAFNVSDNLNHLGCRRCTARPNCTRSGLNATCCWLPGLVPATNYTVDVAALNGAGEGERSDTASMQTDVTIPPEIQEIPDLGSPSQTTLAIQIARCSNTNGPISHYQIIVVAVLPDSGFDVSRSPQDLYPDGYDYTGSAATVRESLSDSRPVIVYIAAEFAEGLLFNGSEMTKSYTLGSRSQPNDQRLMYTNGELRPGTQYTSFVKCFPDTTPSDLSDSRQYGMAGYSRFSPLVPTDPDNLVIIVVVVVILLLLIVAIVVICVVFICCCIVRKRNKDYYFEDNNRDSQLGFGSFGDRKDDMETGFNDDAPKKEIHLPIPVHQLGQAIEHLKRDENRGFQVEYQSIKDNSPQHSIDCFKIPENKPKNRYGNITCYDDTRVKLQETDDTGSDYINASYMNGYNREREYIASQGPLPITLGDFWKMIWEQDVYSIVMLTLVIEGTKIKCQQYWPKSDDATYGSFVVRVLDENVYATYTIRTLEVRMTDEKVTKEVKQFHFTSWPDFGVPLNAGPLLKFLRCVRSHHTYSNPKPMLMHCSAGVGRTGTLLALDVELQRAAMEKVVDPYNFVLHMRDQRNLMVQTESQYVFLYEAITEGLNRDYDEFPVTSLKDKMAENADFEEDTGQTGFEKEFKYLVGTSKVDTRQFSSANESVNSRKNRFLNFLPYNFSRVQLEQLPGLEGSDYINASFMDGYREKAAFIATQGPVPDTTADFWRMVWEKNSSCIVMLTQLMENNIEMCSEYWPKEGESVEYGPYEIKTVSERPMEDYVQREMEITDKTLEVHDKRTLTQFHFLSWPERGSPVSGAGMIDLIDQVRRVQMKTGNHPVVVHCSNGTGRTGAFISLTVAMEHVRTENLVDVFGTVKNLRTQRPHMIQTLEQYIFCYTTISEYVDSMDTYANYK